MGKGSGSCADGGCALVVICIVSCVFVGFMAGTAYGIYAADEQYEDQKAVQDWAAVPGLCTVALMGWHKRSEYECNCYRSGDHEYCDTCTYTSHVAVRSSAWVGYRKAMWCGPGWSKTDEGSSLDAYRFNGSQIPCWYDENYDSSANSGNPDAQDATVKFVQCSEDIEEYVATVIGLSILLCCLFTCYAFGCCAFCVKSKACDNCGDFCHSSGKCAKKIGKYVFLCKCCTCCHKKYWKEESSDVPRTEYEPDGVGVHIEQKEVIAPAAEPAPGGGGDSAVWIASIEPSPMKQVSPVYTADHQAVAPPPPPASPPTGNLERTASAQVSQEHGVSQFQARQMINQGVVEDPSSPKKGQAI